MGNRDWLIAANQIQTMIMSLRTEYIAVAASVIALCTARLDIFQRPAARRLIIAIYLAAAALNLWATLNLRRQHDLMVSYLVGPEMDPLKRYMLRPAQGTYIAMHLCVDIGVAIAVWFLPIKLRKS